MKKVEIYSTQTCHFCHAAKEFFKKNNIEFTDHDVTNDAVLQQDMIKRSGQMSVPVIFVDENMLIGFDENKLKELINIK